MTDPTRQAGEREAFEAALAGIGDGSTMAALDAILVYDWIVQERDAAQRDFATVQEMQKYSTPSDPTGVRNGMRFQAIEAERDALRQEGAGLHSMLEGVCAELAAAVVRAEKAEKERRQFYDANEHNFSKWMKETATLRAEVAALTVERDAAVAKEVVKRSLVTVELDTLRAACERWAAIASGEIQVADDDSEGMGVLYNEIRAALAPRETEEK